METITLKTVITAYLIHNSSYWLSGSRIEDIKNALSSVGEISTKDLSSALIRAGWDRITTGNKEEGAFYIYFHPMVDRIENNSFVFKHL